VVESSGGRIPIAVLVFENRGVNEDDAYMGEAIADEINAQLSKIGGFAVKAHSSARRLNLEQASYAQIADQLGAEYLVHGNWRRDGDSVSVSARLIVPSTEEQLWAEIYRSDWTASDMYDLRSDVAEQIARHLNVGVSPDQSARLAALPTVNTDAYVAYQRGRYFWNDRTEAGLTQAVEHFKHATELDSSFALAYSGLADAYTLLPHYGRRSLDEVAAAPRARAAALKAVALDSMSAEAHTSLAAVHQFFDWDFDAAILEFRKALALNDSYATAHHWYGQLFYYAGRLSEAVAECERAAELDPLSRIIASDLGHHLRMSGRFEEAVLRYRQTLALDSTFRVARNGLAATYRELGRYEEALAEYRKANNARGQREVEVLLGVRADTLALQEQLAEAETAWLMAQTYAAVGNADSALIWLALAFEERSVSVARTFWEPEWDFLRENPRFVELTGQVKYTGSADWR